MATEITDTMVVEATAKAEEMVEAKALKANVTSGEKLVTKRKIVLKRMKILVKGPVDGSPA